MFNIKTLYQRIEVSFKLWSIIIIRFWVDASIFHNMHTLTYNLSIYLSLPTVTASRSNVGTQNISNQLVAGLIIIMKLRLAPLIMVAPPGCCCIIDLLYGPIMSSCTLFSFLVFLGGRRQWRVFIFWTFEISWTSYHTDLIEWHGVSSSIPPGLV